MTENLQNHQPGGFADSSGISDMDIWKIKID